MFKPELEVPDIEYCKKLKEIGLPQNTGGFYWAEYKGEVSLIYNKDIPHYSFYESDIVFKAFTIRELGEWLPSSIEKEYFYTSEAKRIFENRLLSDIEERYLIKYYFVIEKKDGKWFCKYERLNYDEPVILVLFSDIKLSNALAKMLIWLIKNGYVGFENERMYKNFKKKEVNKIYQEIREKIIKKEGEK